MNTLFLEKQLVRLTVFLIPFNLAYHWRIDEAYVNGILIDYLAPALYLSDIPVIVLLLLASLRIKTPTLIQVRQFFPRQWKNPFLLLALYVLITSMLAPRRPPALYFSLKLFEMAFLSRYLTHTFHRDQLKRLIVPPLLYSAGFQVLLGSFQFIFQRNLFEYIYLGETQFTESQFISRTFLRGSQLILPYGTTPHPNVLIGFLSVVLLVVSHRTNKLLKRNAKIVLVYLLSVSYIILTIIINSLTQITAYMLAYIAKRQTSSRLLSLSVCLHIISILIPLLLFQMQFYQYKNISDNPSIYRRKNLIYSSIEMVISKPLFGVGLNQFIPAAAEITPEYLSPAFNQPVHHLGLLWLTQTGIIGLLLFFWCSYSIRHRLQLHPGLFFLLLVGLNDHYPLTHQVGLLLSAFTFSLSLKTKPRAATSQ